MSESRAWIDDLEQPRNTENAAASSSDTSKSSTPSTEGENPEWNDPNDPENPYNFSESRKWLVFLTACFVCFAVGINATAITSVVQEIDTRFNINDERFEYSYFAVTSWNVGAAVVPLFVLPLMENLGTRKIYLTLYALFAIFVIPQAVAENFSTLVVTRFIAGSCGGVLQNIVDGIAADLWSGENERALPLTLYISSLLGGVTIGPVVGGAIMRWLCWRWVFYIQLIVYGACLPLVCLAMTETRGPVILKQRLKRAAGHAPLKKTNSRTSKNSGTQLGQTVVEAIKRPTKMFITEWIVFSFTLWSAFCFGMVFMFTQSVAQVYATTYGWDEFQTGVVQAAIVIGEAVGCLACVMQNWIYSRAGTKGNSPQLEKRLYLSIFGSFIGLTAGFFVYAWTSYPSFPWIAPTVGLGLVGFGTMTVVQAVSVYITDCYAEFAASAIGAVAFGENAFAAFLPLATLNMYNNLGSQWASSFLGFLALVLSFAPVVLVWKGKAIRNRSVFMNKS